MLVTATENVPGYRVLEVKRQVFGVVVRSRGLAGNLMAGLRSIIGGEIMGRRRRAERHQGSRPAPAVGTGPASLHLV